MPQSDVEFKTHDNVILRGWLFAPADHSGGKLPCLVMSHGWSAVKEMDLDAFAKYFTERLSMICLVFDNRGFGASDTAPGQPRFEIIPSVQHSDIQDAITYAQGREDVDPSKIGIWGSSYSGGHALQVAAIDKRVKAVISQAPLVNGVENFNRLVRSDFQPGLRAAFQQDRLDRAAGKPPAMVPNVDANPMSPSALPTPDSYEFFSAWEKKSPWKNEITVKRQNIFFPDLSKENLTQFLSLEGLTSYNPSHQIENIAPTPLLMVVAQNDVLTPADLALKAYSRAHEPKQLSILPGAGHFDAYTGKWFEGNAATQTEFLKKNLCSLDWFPLSLVDRKKFTGVHYADLCKTTIRAMVDEKLALPKLVFGDYDVIPYDGPQLCIAIHREMVDKSGFVRPGYFFVPTKINMVMNYHVTAHHLACIGLGHDFGKITPEQYTDVLFRAVAITRKTLYDCSPPALENAYSAITNAPLHPRTVVSIPIRSTSEC